MSGLPPVVVVFANDLRLGGQTSGAGEEGGADKGKKFSARLEIKNASNEFVSMLYVSLHEVSSKYYRNIQLQSFHSLSGKLCLSCRIMGAIYA